ncbi:cyclase family protein [Flagellimonas flava]|uniref:cyclase family protein n=1 Tax=Flagellimonas flava TaxID=570519 RepID=UPI003D661B4F
MITTIKYNSKNYKIDLSKPLDISIPLRGDKDNVNAWYLDPPRIEPHQEGKFIGKVSEGASTNFNDIWFNPHSHVTHTECLGHITKAFHSVNQKLKRYFFWAEVITVAPERQGKDFVISEKQLRYALGTKKREAVIIRTIPNLKSKCAQNYSNTNPPYLLKEALEFLVGKGILHLLVDLPSVDKEKDGGALAGHHTFWNTAEAPRVDATITELIYVDNEIKDGPYFLNLQVAPFENDASPSRPVLYQIENQ